MKIRPVRTGAEFRFRVHFENLTSEELGQLVNSIRPTPASRFKVGLGKPLGLGTVRLDIDDRVAEFDFPGRYTEAGVAAELSEHIRTGSTETVRTWGPLHPTQAYRELHEVAYGNVAYPRVSYPADAQPSGEDKLYGCSPRPHSSTPVNTRQPAEPALPPITRFTGIRNCQNVRSG